MKIRASLILILLVASLLMMSGHAFAVSLLDPVSGNPSTSNVSYNHWSSCKVLETITALGGNTWKYSYEFTNLEASSIWHFGVWTNFVVGAVTNFAQMNQYGTWSATSHNITGVVAAYDARNLDPNIVWVTETWDSPWPNSPHPIAVNAYVSGFSFNASVLDQRPKYFFIELLGHYIPNGILDAVGKTRAKSIQYHFGMKEFTDQLFVNVSPQTGGSLIYGYDDVPYYSPGFPASLLGWASGNNFYMAIDYKDAPGIFDMSLLIGTVSTRTAKMYRTYDGTTWVGPTTVTLTSLSTNAEEDSRRASAVCSNDASATLKFQYRFTMSPFIDHVWTNVTAQAGGSLLNGYANLTYASIGYPAPMLGWASGNNFYMAFDYQDAPGLFDMSLLIGTVSTRTGKLYRTYDGTSFVGPTAVTLVPF